MMPLTPFESLAIVAVVSILYLGAVAIASFIGYHWDK